MAVDIEEILEELGRAESVLALIAWADSELCEKKDLLGGAEVAHALIEKCMEKIRKLEAAA